MNVTHKDINYLFNDEYIRSISDDYFEHIEYIQNMRSISTYGLILSIIIFIIITMNLILNRVKKIQSKKIFKIIWLLSFIATIIMAISLIVFMKMPV